LDPGLDSVGAELLKEASVEYPPEASAFIGTVRIHVAGRAEAYDAWGEAGQPLLLAHWELRARVECASDAGCRGEHAAGAPMWVYAQGAPVGVPPEVYYEASGDDQVPGCDLGYERSAVFGGSVFVACDRVGPCERAIEFGIEGTASTSVNPRNLIVNFKAIVSSEHAPAPEIQLRAFELMPLTEPFTDFGADCPLPSIDASVPSE
jgi:hypothetical protein